MHDDLIVCLLGDSLTRAEHTLIGGGHHASVLDTRGGYLRRFPLRAKSAYCCG
jgi:hypothetical protein